MKKSKIAAALLIAMSSVAMSAAKADVIYYFSNAGVYNNTPTLSDQNVFATAKFEDVTVGTKSEVLLTMTVLSGISEEVGQQYLTKSCQKRRRRRRCRAAGLQKR